MPDHDTRAIANELLERAEQDGYRLTNMQLQKLSYIAHGWGLALLGTPLIRDVPQVWQFGPVYPDLHQALRRYGSKNIMEPIRERDREVSAFVDGNPRSRGNVLKEQLSGQEKGLLDVVWRNYKKYSAFQLSEMTHRPGTPWTEIYQNTGAKAPIDNTLIRNHYKKLAENGKQEQ